MTSAQISSMLGYLFSPIYAAFYPPAHVDQVFNAGVKGSQVDAHFRVSSGAPYKLNLNLYFRDGDNLDRQRVHTLSGTGQYSGLGTNAHQINTGLSIPVHVSIERVDDHGKVVILDGLFRDHDLEGFTEHYYSKVVTGARLAPGNYHLRVEAVQDIPALEGTPVHVELQSSQRN